MTEKELIEKLNSYYDEGLSYVKPRHKKWKTQYEYYRNKKDPPNQRYLESKIRCNYIAVIIAVKLPVMVNNKPNITYVSRNKSEEQENNADVMSKVVGRYVWQKNEMKSILKDALKDAMILDIGFMKTYYDASKNEPYGEVVTECVDPFKLIIDPYAIDIDKARYTIYVDKLPESIVKKRYPHLKKEKITASDDNTTTEIIYEERKWDQMEELTDSTTPRVEIKEYYIAGSEFDKKESASIVKQYINRNKNKHFDVLLAEINLTITDIEQYGMSKEEVLAYMTDVLLERVKKGGIYVTTINDTVVAEMKPNPYAHGKCPYIPFYSDRLAHCLYGKGDVEDIISLQNALNEKLSQLHDAALKTTSPTYMADARIGAEEIKKMGKIFRPRTVIVAQKDWITPLNPPVIPAWSVRQIPETVNMIERQSGIPDIMQGFLGTSKHRTASGIFMLKETGTTRISTSIDYMEIGLTRWAYKTATIVQQFFDEERVLSIAGDKNFAAEILTVTPDDLEGEFEVSVDSGASLPQDKMSKIDMALQVWDKKIIHEALLHLGDDNAIRKIAADYILDMLELPHRDELRKMKPPASVVAGGQPGPMGPGGAVGPAQQVGPTNIPPPVNMPPESAAVMNTMQQAGLTPEELAAMQAAAQQIR